MNNILYIPGLGGDRSIKMQKAWVSTLNVFRSQNRKIHFFDPKWETAEAYEQKFSRLQAFYDAAGQPSRVWAISAGASLAVSLYVTAPPETKVHLVCGKVLNPNSIGEHYQRRAPAMVASVISSTENAARISPENVTSYVPENNADGVIESNEMYIEGWPVVSLPPLKHARAIGYSLARYLPRL